MFFLKIYVMPPLLITALLKCRRKNIFYGFIDSFPGTGKYQKIGKTPLFAIFF